MKGRLFKEFKMKGLRRLKYFLGIEVLTSKARIFISERKYVLNLLVETGMIDCTTAETPIIVNHGLQINIGAKLANKEQY